MKKRDYIQDMKEGCFPIPIKGDIDIFNEIIATEFEEEVLKHEKNITEIEFPTILNLEGIAEQIYIVSCKKGEIFLIDNQPYLKSDRFFVAIEPKTAIQYIKP